MSFFFTQNTQNYGKREARLFLFHAEYAELLEWSPLCADTLRVIASKAKQSRKQFCRLDCFVVPPRNDAKRREVNARQVLRILRFLREIIFA